MYIHKLITVAAHFPTLFAYSVVYIFFNTSGEDSHPYSTNSLILSVLTLFFLFFCSLFFLLSQCW